MATPIPANQVRFSREELRTALGDGIEVTGDFGGVVGVTTDSRAALDGKLFVALAGARFDGHDYVSQALESGARAVLVDEARAGSLALPAHAPVIVVHDSLKALGDLARFHRSRWGGRLVAIGGSAGKTTTKGAAFAILNALRPGRVLATPGNLNNRIGVPMTLLTLEPHHELAVIEIGTNQSGEVAELARIAAPTAGLLTLIDLEHTSGLGDLDGVEREECALFEAVCGAEGVLIGNVDDERIRAVLSRRTGAKVVSYGEREGATVRILGRRIRGDLSSEVTLAVANRQLTFKTPRYGRPVALAIAGGIAAAFGLLDELPNWSLLPPEVLDEVGSGRSSLLTLTSGARVLDDSYNANPASMLAGIESAQELTAVLSTRLTLVLGEMRELGNLSVAEHERLGAIASESGAYRIVFVGGDARHAAEAARRAGVHVEFVESAEEARTRVLPALGPSDLVLLKGSRGIGLERIISGAVTGAPGHHP